MKCTHATDEVMVPWPLNDFWPFGLEFCGQEQRPNFTELVRLLRGMRDLPEKDSQEATKIQKYIEKRTDGP